MTENRIFPQGDESPEETMRAVSHNANLLTKCVLDENKSLKARVGVLDGALRHYAEPDNWVSDAESDEYTSGTWIWVGAYMRPWELAEEALRGGGGEGV